MRSHMKDDYNIAQGIDILPEKRENKHEIGKTETNGLEFINL